MSIDWWYDNEMRKILNAAGLPGKDVRTVVDNRVHAFGGFIMKPGTIASFTWVLRMPESVLIMPPEIPSQEWTNWKQDMRDAGFTHIELMPPQLTSDNRFRVITAFAEVPPRVSVAEATQAMFQFIKDLQSIVGDYMGDETRKRLQTVCTNYTDAVLQEKKHTHEE